MNIVGIDPGKNGGVVVLNDRGEIVEKKIMPLIADTDLDVIEVSNIITINSPCIIFVEDVHAIYGSAAGATFSFGWNCGAIDAILQLKKEPYIRVQPKAWQKVAYQGISEIRNPSKNGKKGRIDTKAMSEVAAKRLFPTADLRRNDRCKVVHDGIVDALLIAEYGRRHKK